jgi:hypothetical protein
VSAHVPLDGERRSDQVERIWPESNCYIDLWVSVLRDLSLEPEAMLACTAAPRFEGDQWTFCKPTATELAELYGLRVEELTIWRSLREHVAVQLELGRLVLVEVDAFHLPDTAGVSYRSAHQKTTIGIIALDEKIRRLDYYHNAGRFELKGNELDAVLSSRILGTDLPPFAELVDSSRVGATRSDLLRERSRAIAARRLAGVGTGNPFSAWAARAAHDTAQLRANDLEFFHAWAFASVRQAGAMAEHLAIWCDWVDGDPAIARAAESLRTVARTLKAQQFRLARLPRGGTADLAAALEPCVREWSVAQDAIARLCDRRDESRPVSLPEGRSSLSRAAEKKLSGVP